MRTHTVLFKMLVTKMIMLRGVGWGVCVGGCVGNVVTYSICILVHLGMVCLNV